MGPKLLRKTSSALAVSLLLLSPLVLAACAPSASSRLVITQSSDAPSGADHKGHLSPGAFTGITLSIRNTGAGAARGLTVEDILPAGFHYYELTTLGGNAIRTATSDPEAQGNPSWGTWTIPAGNGNTVSALVLSFKVQVALSPGDYKNQVKLTTSAPAEIDQGDPVALVIEPRPSLTLTAAAATAQVTTGGLATYIISVANVGSAVAKGVAGSGHLGPRLPLRTPRRKEGPRPLREGGRNGRHGGGGGGDRPRPPPAGFALPGHQQRREQRKEGGLAAPAAGGVAHAERGPFCHSRRWLQWSD